MKKIFLLISILFIINPLDMKVYGEEAQYDSNASVSFYGEYIPIEKEIDLEVNKGSSHEKSKEVLLPETGENNTEHYIGILLFVLVIFLFWRNHEKEV